MTCSYNWLRTSSLRSALLIIVTIKWCQFGQFSAQKNTFSSVPLTKNMKILIYIFHSFLCQSLDLENLLGVGENLPFMKDLLTVLDEKKKKIIFPFRNSRVTQKYWKSKFIFKIRITGIRETRKQSITCNPSNTVAAFDDLCEKNRNQTECNSAKLCCWSGLTQYLKIIKV